jgi:hypothetical protein
VERIMTLPPEQQEERLREWVLGYEARMIRLAEIVEQPYGEALPAIRRLDEEKEKLQEGELPRGANPLIPILVPTMEKLYQRFLLAEAQYDILGILSAGALYRAQAGRWPVNTEELAEVTTMSIPHDPFTGDEYYYKLIQVRPRIAARAPKWLARETDHAYQVDITRRRNEDQARYEEAAKRMRAARAQQIMRRMQEQEAGGTGVEDAVPLK